MTTPNFIVSIAIDDVINALTAFLLPFTGGDATKIVRAQQNRVSLPAAPCVVLTEMIGAELSTPTTSYDSTDGTETITGPTQINVQIDFYGTNAGDVNKAVAQAFRTLWASTQFPDGIKPLYTDGGHQAPFTDGEDQYEIRWILVASMQYNPSVAVPMQFPDALNVGIFSAVDVET
jgi:hypothetical protein